MVLESLIPSSLFKHKVFAAFFMGWFYSIIGIMIASLIFPKDPALVAIAFTSILLLPSLHKFMQMEKEKIGSEKKFSMRSLYDSNKDLVKIYVALFFGILLVYSTAAIVLSSFQVNALFKTQLDVRGISGSAFNPSLFWDIFINNWWVLAACFLISLLTSDGGIFLITWNASVWGTIFGVTARNAAIVSFANPFIYLLMIMMIVLPHVFLESLSYILGAISGGVISKSITTKTKKFENIIIYNIILFAIAINVLILGGLVETWVLGNVNLYSEIIIKSLQVPWVV